MSELAPSELIQRLEQRHDQLLEELDSLNERLEQALNSIAKPLEGSPGQAAAIQPAN